MAMYYKLEQIGFYFVVPTLRWLLAIFLVMNFIVPLSTTWAGDMLAHFFQMLSDEVHGFFLKFLPGWMK